MNLALLALLGLLAVPAHAAPAKGSSGASPTSSPKKKSTKKKSSTSSKKTVPASGASTTPDTTTSEAAPPSPGTLVATTFFVSRFVPDAPELRDLAETVEAEIVRGVQAQPAWKLLRAREVPDLMDGKASVYLASCPAGDMVGCTQVVAARGGAVWAVTGRVLEGEGSPRVEVTLLDVDTAREVVTFGIDVPSELDASRIDGIVRVLAGAVAGEFNAKDVRDRSPDDPADAVVPIDKEMVALQLAQLSGDLAAISVESGNRKVKAPLLTAEDVADRARDEGGAPWERLGMTAGTYLQYKNSGLTLAEWRKRAQGHAGQVLLRPYLGVMSGPYGGAYYGRFAYKNVGSALVVVDALSEQAVQAGTGGTVGGSVGYGLTPWLDVGAAAGLVSGSFTVDIDQSTVGQPDAASPVDRRTGASWYAGPRVTASFLPTRGFHPVVGTGVSFVGAQGVSSVIEVPPQIVGFDGPLLVQAELLAGFEARMGERVDFYVHLPVHVHVAGDLRASERTGNEAVLTAYQPDVAGAIGGGLQAGLQFRLGGKAVRATNRVEEIEDELGR